MTIGLFIVGRKIRSATRLPRVSLPALNPQRTLNLCREPDDLFQPPDRHRDL